MTSKELAHIFFTTWNFVVHFIATDEFKLLKLQFGNAQFGSKVSIFVPCELEIRRTTSTNKMTPLPCHFELCTTFRNHRWIQIWVTVLNVKINAKLVLISVTLAFNRWPWSPTRAPFLSLHLKISWWHDEKNIVKKMWKGDRQTDERTVRRTEPFLELLGRCLKGPQKAVRYLSND